MRYVGKVDILNVGSHGFLAKTVNGKGFEVVPVGLEPTTPCQLLDR